MQTDIDLTNKGQAYAAAALAEANGVFFLTVDGKDRASISTSIEKLINMLDDMEPDPDLELNGDEFDQSYPNGCQKTDQPYEDAEEDDCGEANGDDEPSLGAQEVRYPCSQEHWAQGGKDDREDDGDSEPFLGWRERDGQGNDEEHRKGLAPVYSYDPAGDPNGADLGQLHFDGSGKREAHELLSRVKKPRRDPDELTIIRPGVARIGPPSALSAKDFWRMPWA
ncbi:MAG: hypothetical protein JNK47_02790 [Mesorhizobium sp.]|nr:hypothetical protein [Mesorhizobium sp.]MBL8576127.1 hypothetical protein [Mesorhizobium sp.]